MTPRRWTPAGFFITLTAMLIGAHSTHAWADEEKDASAKGMPENGNAEKSTAKTEGPRKTIALLPLVPEGDVERDETYGLDAMMRTQAEQMGAFRVVPERDGDLENAILCRQEAACLAEAAINLGVDFVGSGKVAATDTGYSITYFVIGAKDKDFTQAVRQDVGGGETGLNYGLDRLVRRAFAPATLAGGLIVIGSPAGATVLVDGKSAGVLPLDGPIIGLLEGKHVLSVTKPGFQDFEKPIQISFGEAHREEVVLSPASGKGSRQAGGSEGDESEATPWYVYTPIMGVTATGLLVAGAAIAGGFSYIDQREVERRAERQQLFFPRDTHLVTRGQTMATAANILWATSAVAAIATAIASGVAGYSWWQERKKQNAPPPQLEQAPEGAPDENQLQPEVEPLI